MRLDNLFESNYFELFSLRNDYLVDLKELQRNFLALQKKFHPDKFIATNTELFGAAIGVSARINQAYKCLISPKDRAIYLLNLAGINLELNQETKFSGEFLTKQIAWREQIEEGSNNANLLLGLDTKLENEIINYEQRIASGFSVKNHPIIIKLVKELAFYIKLRELVSNYLDNL